MRSLRSCKVFQFPFRVPLISLNESPRPRVGRHILPSVSLLPLASPLLLPYLHQRISAIGYIPWMNHSTENYRYNFADISTIFRGLFAKCARSAREVGASCSRLFQLEGYFFRRVNTVGSVISVYEVLFCFSSREEEPLRKLASNAQGNWRILGSHRAIYKLFVSSFYPTVILL